MYIMIFVPSSFRESCWVCNYPAVSEATMAVILKAERAILGSAQSLLSRQEGPIMTTDNSGLVIGVVFACLVFIALTIAVRLLVRKMMPHHRLYLDDGLVLVASLLVLSLCMVALEGKGRKVPSDLVALFADWPLTS